MSFTVHVGFLWSYVLNLSFNLLIQIFLFESVGPFHHKFLRALLPFWSSALPTLPVTAPARKDGSNATESSEVRARHQKSSRMDPRKILLLIAIMYSSFLILYNTYNNK
jgi:hypothetical protein